MSKFRIQAPNYTQTPNDLFDHWLPLLGEAELKVLLVIMRKTFGWHKTHDRISVSQLAKLTGMTEEPVIKAAKSLQKKGIISRKVIGKNGSQQTIYSLIVEEDSKKSYPSEKTRASDRPLVSNPPVENEAQKKPFSSKENKQQQAASAAAAVPSKKEPIELEVYGCLKEIDIPKKEKVWLTRKHDEQTVQEAIAWATSPQTTITTTLAQALKWACKERPEMPKSTVSNYDKVRTMFENGGVYNQASCDLNEQGIAFTRGMKHESVKFDRFFKLGRLVDLCESFGIHVRKLL